MSKKYWEEYSNLQHVKHELIRNYLNGWLPKLTLGAWGSGRVLYFDTHAGRGTHKEGQLGSPLVALETVLNHTFFSRFKSEIKFFFIESDEENLGLLQKELEKYKLPSNVEIHCEQGDCFEVLQGIVDSLKAEGKKLAPSFVFCDPFGFNVPFSVLAALMKFQRVELFVNVIWRELDMAIAQGFEGKPAGMVDRLTHIFDGDDWRGIDSTDFDERAEQCVHILRECERLNCRWINWGVRARRIPTGRAR